MAWLYLSLLEVASRRYQNNKKISDYIMNTEMLLAKKRVSSHYSVPADDNLKNTILNLITSSDSNLESQDALAELMLL